MAELVDSTAWANFMRVNDDMFKTMTEVYQMKHVLLDQIQSKGGRVDAGGRTMEVPFEITPSGSYGNIQENELYPEPDGPTATYGSVTIKTAAARIRLTERSILASTGQGKAWAQSKMKLMSNLVEVFMENQNRELYGWGAGVLAKVVSISAPSSGVYTITVDADQANAQNAFGTKYLRRGMRFTNSTTITGTTIDGTSDMIVVNPRASSTTFTAMGDPGDIADNEYIVLGSKERPSLGRAMTGLMAIASTTLASTYLGLTRSSNTFLNPQVTTGVGSADLDKTIQTTMDALDADNGLSIDTLITTYGVRRAYFDQHVPELRYVSAAETGRFKGNFKYLVFQSPDNQDLPLLIDRDCPAGFLMGLSMQDFYFATLPGGEPGWFKPQMDGGSIWSHIPDYGAWDAYYRTHRELVCLRPNRQFFLSGITET